MFTTKNIHLSQDQVTYLLEGGDDKKNPIGNAINDEKGVETVKNTNHQEEKKKKLTEKEEQY